MGKEAAEKKKGHGCTEADYKRASAPSPGDFRRMNAFLRPKKVEGAHKMSRRAYARLVSKIKDDVLVKTDKKKKMKKDKKKKKELESFDPDSQAMQEEKERRIKWAKWINAKEMAEDDDEEVDLDDPDLELMDKEFTRRINWSFALSKKCGNQASHAAAKLLNDAVEASSSSTS